MPRVCSLMNGLLINGKSFLMNIWMKNQYIARNVLEMTNQRRKCQRTRKENEMKERSLRYNNQQYLRKRLEREEGKIAVNYTIIYQEVVFVGVPLALMLYKNVNLFNQIKKHLLYIQKSAIR